jgi:predicted RNase H-like nuclease
MGITIIGIDCAVEDKNVGLALATFDGREAHIDQVAVGVKEGSVVDIVADWIKQHPTALLALDAPLGWPVGLRKALRNHKAGKPIRVEPDKMFRRETDLFVKSEFGKTPLDVGADRIARTAHRALELLHKLRARTGQEIPLAWKPSMISRTRAIEVYPAGTLKVHGIDAPGYKEKDAQDARLSLLAQLEQHHLKPPTDVDSLGCLKRNAHALDAAICVLAGADFLREEVIPPPDLKLAKKEGWIWVRSSE